MNKKKNYMFWAIVGAILFVYFLPWILVGVFWILRFVLYILGEIFRLIMELVAMILRCKTIDDLVNRKTLPIWLTSILAGLFALPVIVDSEMGGFFLLFSCMFGAVSVVNYWNEKKQ